MTAFQPRAEPGDQVWPGVESATQDLNAQVFSSPGLAEAEVRQATALLSSLRAAHGDTVG